MSLRTMSLHHDLRLFLGDFFRWLAGIPNKLSWLPVFFWSSGFGCHAPENGRTEEPVSLSPVLRENRENNVLPFLRSPVLPFFGRTGRTRSSVPPFSRSSVLRENRKNRVLPRSSVLPFARSSGEPEEPRSSAFFRVPPFSLLRKVTLELHQASLN